MPYWSDSHFRNWASESRWLLGGLPTGKSPSAARASRTAAADAPMATDAVPAKKLLRVCVNVCLGVDMAVISDVENGWFLRESRVHGDCADVCNASDAAQETDVPVADTEQSPANAAILAPVVAFLVAY